MDAGLNILCQSQTSDLFKNSIQFIATRQEFESPHRMLVLFALEAPCKSHNITSP